MSAAARVPGGGVNVDLDGALPEHATTAQEHISIAANLAAGRRTASSL